MYTHSFEAYGNVERKAGIHATERKKAENLKKEKEITMKSSYEFHVLHGKRFWKAIFLMQFEKKGRLYKIRQVCLPPQFSSPRLWFQMEYTK